MLVSAAAAVARFRRFGLLLLLLLQFSLFAFVADAQPSQQQRCATYYSCDSCSRQTGCGWCETYKSCVAGTRFGPTVTSCPSYSYGSCPVEDACTQYNYDCGACKAVGCGWCGASRLCLSRSTLCAYQWNPVCYAAPSSTGATGSSGSSSSNGGATNSNAVSASSPDAIFAAYADGSASSAESSGMAFLVITILLTFVGCFLLLRSISVRPEQGRYFNGPVEGRTARALNRHFLTLLLLGSVSIKIASLFLNKWTVAKLTPPYELNYGILSFAVASDTADELYSSTYPEMCRYVRSSLCNLITAGSGLTIGFAAVSLLLLSVQVLMQCSYQCGQNVQAARTILNSWRLSVFTLFSSNAVWLTWLFGGFVPMRHMHGSATLDISWKLFIITTAIDAVAHLLVHRSVGLEAKLAGAAVVHPNRVPGDRAVGAVEFVQPERFRGQAPPLYAGVPNGEGVANVPVHYGVAAVKPAAGPGMSGAALAILDPEEYNRMNSSVLIHADAPPAYEEQPAEGGIRIHVERYMKEREARYNSNRTPPPPTEGADHLSSPVRTVLAPHPRSQSTLRPSSGSSATPMSRSRISISRSQFPISLGAVEGIANGYAPVITMVDEPEPDHHAAASSGTIGAAPEWASPPSPRAVSLSMRGMAPPAYPGAPDEEIPDDAIDVSANHREDDVEIDDQEERKGQ